MTIGSRAVFDARMRPRCGLVVFLVAQVFEYQIVEQLIRRLAHAARSACECLGQVGVERLQIAMFGSSACGSSPGLSVNFSAMPGTHNGHDAYRVLKITNQSVITNAITPCTLIALHGLPDSTGIVKHPRFNVRNNPALNLQVKLAQRLKRCRTVLSLPGQGAFLLRRVCRCVRVSCETQARRDGLLFPPTRRESFYAVMLPGTSLHVEPRAQSHRPSRCRAPANSDVRKLHP